MPEELCLDDRFNRTAVAIAEQSSLPVIDIRLVAALLFWQRMVPDHLFRTAGSGADIATEASLDWASRQLLANDPMLKFIYDAKQAPKHTPKLRLRDYVPILASLDEATDRSLRKAFYSCGFITELLLMLPFRCGTTGEVQVKASATNRIEACT